jgi:hypothetical protein
MPLVSRLAEGKGIQDVKRPQTNTNWWLDHQASHVEPIWVFADWWVVPNIDYGRLLTAVHLDSFSLLGKALLPEMSHAREAWTKYYDDKDEWQIGLLDEKDHPRSTIGGPWNFHFLNAAYGWKAAMRLARQGNELNERGAADNNADTLALFGSGTFRAYLALTTTNSS